MKRLHIVGLPFEPQHQCAYSGKIERLIRMMRDRGHEVNDVACPSDIWDDAREFNPDNQTWEKWNALAVTLIQEQYEAGDIVGIIAGRCQQPIVDAFPFVTEIGVGYGGTCTQFRVFESYAWMHTVYGSQAGANPHDADGCFYDTVIPNYFDTTEFPLGEGGVGFAFVGRLITRKGVRIVADVCQRLGEHLAVAGEGPNPPEYGELVGVVGPAERAWIMGRAKAVFVPTEYVEPFGGVAIESMLCGTPVITTDFGAFPEYVIDGFNGYKCHTLQEFIDAAQAVETLDRVAIREWAQDRYSMEAIAPRYEQYFERLQTLWGQGFYELRG